MIVKARTLALTFIKKFFTLTLTQCLYRRCQVMCLNFTTINNKTGLFSLYYIIWLDICMMSNRVELREMNFIKWTELYRYFNLLQCQLLNVREKPSKNFPQLSEIVKDRHWDLSKFENIFLFASFKVCLHLLLKT